jgi:hypothetical protein
MKVYGMKIDSIGLEFSSIADREKALLTFTKGSTVKISTSSGIRYKDCEAPFGCYERETKEIIANCAVCDGSFSTETCSRRTYPHKNSWEKEYQTVENHICDACLVKKNKEKELFDAKKLIGETEF